MALTPGGGQLYVTQQTLDYVDVIDTADNTMVSDLNLAGTGEDNLNYDDGFEPDGIVTTSLPSPGWTP